MKKSRTQATRGQSKGTRAKGTWITNAVIVTQNDNRDVMKGALFIRDGIIEEIRKSVPTAKSKSSQASSIIDAKGLYVLPGFIQPHIHLCQTLFRNMADDMELLDWLSKRIWVMESNHTASTLYTSAAVGIAELLASGTTCILDMGTVRHTESVYQAALDLGIRANIGKCLMDSPDQTPPYLRDSTEKAYQEAVALYDKWNGRANDRIRASFAPRFVPSCTPELLTRISKVARDKGALIHTHASENRKEVEWVQSLFGKNYVEVLEDHKMCSPNLVLAHCVWFTEHEKEIVKRSGTHLVHCPSSNLKLASGIAPVPELLKMGINVAIGADGAPCNNNLNIFQEMRLASLIQKPGNGPTSMKAYKVLDMATRNGAKALQWFQDIGSIEVGKKADLVALDLNDQVNFLPEHKLFDLESIASSIVYSSNQSHVKWTMVDGKLVYKNGKISKLNRTRLLDDLRKAQNTIVRKSKNLF